MSRATEATDRPAAPRPVSVATCLAVRAANWNSRLMAGDAVPAAWASRNARATCPPISASPTTIESRPAATVNR